jgi:glycosyltransferase involved in cell wall biosynthesis
VNRPLKILVEGWRDIPHSYALVLSFQLLELLKRPHLRLHFQPVPYFNPNWKRLSTFSAEEQAALDAIPAPASGQADFDVVYRAAYPFNLSAASGNTPALVFATTEFKKIPDDCVHDFSRLGADRVTITSPSRWSAAPFIGRGVTPLVLPHGVDPFKFRVLSAAEKAEARRALGLQPEHFVFAQIGGMSQNKGIVPLLQAFLRLVPDFPHVRLVLKGLGNLYNSRKMVQEYVGAVRATPTERAQLIERLVFLDGCFDFATLNQVYNAADCYVAPYFGEGFALPVIEALACEVPVLVSDGGATDDYVAEPLFHIPAQSRLVLHNGSTVLECGVDNLVAKMQDVLARREVYRAAASTLGASIRDQYSWTRIVDRLEQLLAQLADAKR